MKLKNLPGAKKSKKLNLGKRLEKAEKELEELKKSFELSLDQQSQKLAELSRLIARSLSDFRVIWENQVELTKSANNLDRQFAVMGRIFISKLNNIVVTIGHDDILTYQGVNAAFDEWDQFHQRPDFRDHMEQWFLGGDLSKLPPPPRVEKKEAEQEQPKEFGGDYDKSGDRASTREGVSAGGSEGHEETAVPSGQDLDKASSQGPAVSSL